MDSQRGSCQEEKQGSPYLIDDSRPSLIDNGCVILPRRTWREAFNDKAMLIDWNLALEATTLGYKIVWHLWSADIWFGRFPLLKFVVAANVAVWIILFLTT